MELQTGEFATTQGIPCNRYGRPDMRYGDRVWFREEMFYIESIELHGETWTAAVVRPREFGGAECRCTFVPCARLEVDRD